MFLRNARRYNPEGRSLHTHRQDNVRMNKQTDRGKHGNEPLFSPTLEPETSAIRSEVRSHWGLQALTPRTGNVAF
jgi:hypothetical protein